MFALFYDDIFGPEPVDAWEGGDDVFFLDELRGLEERVGLSRPTGGAFARDFHGPNWRDLRAAAAAYRERDPAVLVVGGGQGGLSIAARLAQRGVDTLIEIGTGKVLSGLTRRIDRDLSARSVQSPADIEALLKDL